MVSTSEKQHPDMSECEERVLVYVTLEFGNSYIKHVTPFQVIERTGKTFNKVTVKEKIQKLTVV